MPHFVAAPDKFRGTASASEAAAAAATAAREAGWTADEVPMSDGGEGLLDACGGARREASVAGPLGQTVLAEWRLLEPSASGQPGSDQPGSGQPGPEAPLTAVIEMSKAAGRALVPRPRGDDPVRATTAGVGQLLLAARDAGARRIVIGCGGSATTDGGEGAFDAVGSPDALRGVELVVASDVTTSFVDAAAVFGPQKGATPAQVHLLERRLTEVAARYRREVGVDVTEVAGAGAAGGLAGGLLALGARIEPGFHFVAGLVGLAARLEPADLVFTGEGHLDPPSFHGKVPGGVLALARARSRRGPDLPVLCVAGGVDAALADSPPDGMTIVSLVARFGQARARAETAALIGQVTAHALARFCP